jgi:hypothetical protein
MVILCESSGALFYLVGVFGMWIQRNDSYNQIYTEPIKKEPLDEINSIIHGLAQAVVSYSASQEIPVAENLQVYYYL